MSLPGDKASLHPKACGNCRWWAPWLRQSDFLGTCGREGVNLGQCTDKHGTCDQFEEKPRYGAVQVREHDIACGMKPPEEPK